MLNMTLQVKCNSGLEQRNEPLYSGTTNKRRGINNHIKVVIFTIFANVGVA